LLRGHSLDGGLGWCRRRGRTGIGSRAGGRRRFHDRLADFERKPFDLSAAETDSDPVPGVDRDLLAGLEHHRAADDNLEGRGLPVGAHANVRAALEPRRAEGGEDRNRGDGLVDLRRPELDGDGRHRLSAHAALLEAKPGALADPDDPAPGQGQARARGRTGAERVADDEWRAGRDVDPGFALAAFHDACRLEQRGHGRRARARRDCQRGEADQGGREGERQRTWPRASDHRSALRSTLSTVTPFSSTSTLRCWVW
jgi:hypothetical protein